MSDTLRELCETLIGDLQEARETIEGWAAYATDYFQQKHDLAGDLKAIDERLARARAALEAAPASVFMSSRRTVNSGEVVTLATALEERDGVFGKDYKALGPFEISASRDGVCVHRAWLDSEEDHNSFRDAMCFAKKVHTILAPHWRGGHPSQFPSDPTQCRPDSVQRLPLEDPSESTEHQS